MILIAQTITIPLSVWLLKSFFDDVPIDIEEAAQVDGASLASGADVDHAAAGLARHHRHVDVCLRLHLEQY